MVVTKDAIPCTLTCKFRDIHFRGNMHRTNKCCDFMNAMAFQQLCPPFSSVTHPGTQVTLTTLFHVEQVDCKSCSNASQETEKSRFNTIGKF